MENYAKLYPGEGWAKSPWRRPLFKEPPSWTLCFKAE